ncbi:hypothetical protein ScPMuIL_008670 [Solemya velum]
MDTESVVSSWKIKELEEIICRLQTQNAEQKKVLSQQTNMMSQLRTVNIHLQQKLKLFEQTQKVDSVLQNQVKDGPVGTQETILHSQTSENGLPTNFEEILRQKTLLEKELVEIRGTSRAILNVYVNDCKGVAVGGVNDITMHNTDEESITEMSAEVKKNLETILSRIEELSTLYHRMNHQLSDQTEAIEKIESSVSELSGNPAAADSTVVSELQNIKRIIQQTRQRHGTPINESRSSVAFSDTSWDSASKLMGGFAMWSLQDDQQRVVDKLDVIPKMNTKVENMSLMMERLVQLLEGSSKK